MNLADFWSRFKPIFWPGGRGKKQGKIMLKKMIAGCHARLCCIDILEDEIGLRRRGKLGKIAGWNLMDHFLEQKSRKENSR